MTPTERETFEERAAIMQYCGGLSRSEAEYQAQRLIASARKEQQELF